MRRKKARPFARIAQILHCAKERLFGMTRDAFQEKNKEKT
jgi:hypothetical protein